MNEFGVSVSRNDTYENNQIDSPMPVGLQSFSFHIMAMPIAPRVVSKGGIILADQTRDGESFMNNIVRIVSMGPAAFRSAWWRDRGYIRVDHNGPIPEAHENSLPIPTPGMLVRTAGVRNRQFWFKGVQIIEIDDTQLRSIVNPDDAYDYRFHN